MARVDYDIRPFDLLTVTSPRGVRCPVHAEYPLPEITGLCFNTEYIRFWGIGVDVKNKLWVPYVETSKTGVPSVTVWFRGLDLIEFLNSLPRSVGEY